MPRNQVCELCERWTPPSMPGVHKGECERTRGDIMLMDTFERVSAECSLFTLPNDWCELFEAKTRD